MKRRMAICAVVAAVAGLLMAHGGSASSSTTIWQVGEFDGTRNEFLPDLDTETYFVVGVDPTTAFPGLIRSSDANPADNRYTKSVNSVTIEFSVSGYYGGVVLQYTRMGGEVDKIYYDGAYIGSAGPAPVDPYPATDYFALPGGISPGTHYIRIDGAVKPSHADGYHWVDALKLTGEQLTMSIDDCSPGAYTGWFLVWNGFVSGVGSGSDTPVVSSPPLAAGTYLIEGSGMFSACATPSCDIVADPEYSQDSYQERMGLGWTDSVRNYEGYGEGLLEMKVDGDFVEWGDFNDGHRYTIQQTISDGPLTFDLQVYDIYAQNNLGGLCAAVYQPPSLVWLPPIALDNWTLNEKATLPLKFELRDPGDGLLCTDLSPTLTVSPAGGSLNDLRFDPLECHYIANFRPADVGTFTAAVTLNGVELASREFDVLEAGSPNGRGKAVGHND